MHHNMDTDWSTEGQYSTDVFTEKAIKLIQLHDQKDPLFLYLSQIAPHAGAKNDYLQAPQEEIDKFNHIPNLDKRKYAGKSITVKYFQVISNFISIQLCVLNTNVTS